MTITIRKFLAIVAGCGFGASLIVYFGSFVGLTMDSLTTRVLVLHLGVFFLMIPMFALEWSALNDRTLFWKVFAAPMPKWIVKAISLIGLFFIVHFLVFMVWSHLASPEIVNSQYVLNNHGRIVKILARSDYLRLKGAELRLFATGWLFFYFVSTMYWWFPRSRAAPNQHAAKA